MSDSRPHVANHFCHLCTRWVFQENPLDHLARAHPETADDIERWPDGTPVVWDFTLTPEDFTRDLDDD